MPVTRVEMADHLWGVFGQGPASREALVSAASASGARPAVLGVLCGLPDRSYQELRYLWGDLPHLPVGDDEVSSR